MPAGRPTDFTQELADRICSELADGKSLRKVCEADDVPTKTTIFRWLRTNAAFCDQYTRAKEESADSLTDDMIDIADDLTGDAARDRLRVDTRKWIAAKLKPKKYGDKLQHSGDEDGPPIKIEGRIKLVKP